ncbi:MAG TPA: HAD-IA family hydrolase [Armatimonadota bacterium]|nr:HAD-IA family hydrolase [Armatimonadota bacterium]
MSPVSANKKSCVVFDLGGVMIRLARGWEEAATYAGVPYRQFTGSSDTLAELAHLEEHYSIGAIAPDQFFATVSQVVDGLYAPNEFRAIYQATIQEEFPGIYEMVQRIKHAGLMTACLSNTCASHWIDLTDPQKYPAISSLDIRHASHLFGVAKPDQTIFKKFQQATQTMPEQIVFFDDCHENILAASDCGWDAIEITKQWPSVDQIEEALRSRGILQPQHCG